VKLKHLHYGWVMVIMAACIMAVHTLVFCGTIGGALGTPLAGSIFDATGDYGLAFLICVIICALVIVLSLILLRAQSWRGGD